MTKLALAMPSAPKILGRYVFYYTRRNRESGNISSQGVTIWAAAYAAKHVLELMLNGRDWEWQDDPEYDRRTIVCDDLRIGCAHMQEVVDYKYANKEEGNWHVGEPDRSQLLRAIGLLDGPVVTKEAVRAAQERRTVVRVPRVEKPTGLTTIQQLAAELGKDPGKCRAALRKAKIEKPPHGWAWGADEVEGIKAHIKAV